MLQASKNNPMPQHAAHRRPAWDRRWWAAVAIVHACVAGVMAQPEASPQRPQTGGTETPAIRGAAVAPDALEKYLIARGLKSLLVEHLASRFEQTSGAEKAHLGERLARLMFLQLSAANDLAERQRLEERARQFIKAVGESKSVGLRIELARTSYLRAEQDAEALASAAAPEESRAALSSTLAQLHLQLISLGQDAARRVRALEEKLNSGQSVPSDEEEVGEARAMRSRAYYFAGWAGVYGAETIAAGSGNPTADVPSAESLASGALECFGWHTGRSAMERASLDRLPISLLKHEHVARAVLGIAGALAISGQVAEANRWLDTLENEPAVPAAVRAAVGPRRISVLLTAGYYGEARRQVALVRARTPNAAGGPANQMPPTGQSTKASEAILPAHIARAVAAQAMRLLAGDATRPAAGGASTDPNGDLPAIAETALADLIAARRTDDVLALAERFGTATIGDRGFVAVFVRGMLGLERSLRELRLARGGKLDEAPATDAAMINRLREASETLDAATLQTDAKSYELDMARAVYGSARAQYYAGSDAAAAEKASRAFELAEKINTPLAQDSLWLGILALERQAAEVGSGALIAEKLSSAISLFVSRFPGTLRSATLLVKRPDKTGLSDAKAAEILLSVEADSPLFTESRRAASRILYRMFRDNRTGDRQFAARRFLAVTGEILEPDKRAAMAATGPGAVKAAEAALLLIRQMLDASLTLEPPDVARSEQLLAAAESLVNYNAMDRTRFGRELVFRRFQLAIGRADFATAEKLAADLDAPGDGRDARFIEASNRLLFVNANQRFKAELAAAFASQKSTNPGAATQRGTVQLSAENIANLENLNLEAQAVVRFGGRLIENIGTTARTLGDTGVLALHHDVAAACEVLFATTGSIVSRDLAMKLDKAIVSVRPGDNVSLMRLAAMGENAGDDALSLASWRELSAAVPETSERWFVARYNTIRLTAKTDKATAATLLRQHILLHPTLGPSPWNIRFSELQTSLLSTPAAGTGAAPLSPAPASPAPAPPPAPASVPGAGPATTLPVGTAPKTGGGGR